MQSMRPPENSFHREDWSSRGRLDMYFLPEPQLRQQDDVQQMRRAQGECHYAPRRKAKHATWRLDVPSV
jgi:hypothetical protein